MIPATHRFAIAFAVGLFCGLCSWWYQITFSREAGDFTWALRAAQDLLTGISPYLRKLPSTMVAYPLPAALAAIPFLVFPVEVAAGIFMGSSAAFLTWSVLKQGKYWHLLVFVSFPFWQAVQVVNWTPMLLALMYTPTFLPLVLVKPHTGLPIFLSRFSWARFIACGLFGVVSLLILPDWPLQWLSKLDGYAGRPAVFVAPFGFLLLLTGVHWRNERARYLLFCSLAPLRPFYDYVLLWYLAENYRQMLLLTVLSWVVYFCWYIFPAVAAPTWILFGLYLPLLGMVMWPTVAPRLKQRHRQRVAPHL